ncbi:MAG: hypothetical protein IPK26_22600 [Planctomycetes bacterium]|nr:hypothetical protein [Planctomycetota bacterium]
MKQLPILTFVVLTAAALAPAQELRKALAQADLVAVGRQVGKDAHGDELMLHRVQILDGIRGTEGATAVTVLDWPGLSLHNRPMPRQSRLYCLQDATAMATRLGLPEEHGPYYRMSGQPGSNPLVGADRAADAAVRFARVLAGAEDGARPAVTAAALVELGLHAQDGVGTEAARLLAERPDLRAQLSPPHWSQLAAAASGATAIGHKIALCELCAEQRVPGLIDAMVVALASVQDAEYASAVGRLAAHLHGEEATAMLRERLLRTPNAKERAALLLAIGATRTDSALTALLDLRRTTGSDAAVDAALLAHRSKQARDAVARK